MQPQAGASKREPRQKLVLRVIFRVMLLALIFLCAGRLDWARGWIYVGLLVATGLVNFALMGWKHPGLVRARLEKHEDVKPFDRTFFRFAFPLGLLFLAVAGFDVRFGWSSGPFSLLYAGILLHITGSFPITWATIANPFLELAMRIQHDRGQVPVVAGPYRFVRHPMYVGLIIMFASWPLVLGSLWSFVPLGLLVVAYIVRTAYEDRTLQKELHGYQDYCRRTQYRLVPGVW